MTFSLLWLSKKYSNNKRKKKWKKELKENLTLFLKNWKAEHFLTGNPFMSLLTIFHSEGCTVIDPVCQCGTRLVQLFSSVSFQLMKPEQGSRLTGTAQQLSFTRSSCCTSYCSSSGGSSSSLSSFQMQLSISFLNTSPKYIYSCKIPWQLSDHRQQTSGWVGLT